MQFVKFWRIGTGLRGSSWLEQFVDRNPQHLRQPLQIVEGWRTLSSLNEIEEVEGHVELLGQLLLCPAAGET